ncbi:unnamed protein product [Strongylus vulgaris]|uniref:Uncharacterized protein n=1 Tax=Strongylus vulgaris TaxID=40348 RepID=A0A3P7KQP3_STRVU|nr:unnamed protein product [Strongylus vulgaris]
MDIETGNLDILECSYRLFNPPFDKGSDFGLSADGGAAGPFVLGAGASETGEDCLLRGSWKGLIRKDDMGRPFRRRRRENPQDCRRVERFVREHCLQTQRIPNSSRKMDYRFHGKR